VSIRSGITKEIFGPMFSFLRGKNDNKVKKSIR